MKHWKKYLSVLAVVSCIGLVTAGLGGQDEKASAQGEADEGSDDIGALGGEMAALWGEKACVAEQTTKYEEPVISIACDAEYTSGERDKMLDLLFKKGYKFRGESYDIKGTTGHYWYKFEKRDGSR
ncbi:MAG: hypothetical protein JNJ69_14685, partial [Leptospiraceae bacterium]|nr:hypothetical protein [Leptospiraceae bacterium]